MGKLGHWEIPSTDIAASKRFYAELFGWTFEPYSDTYAMFNVEGGVGGGITKVDEVPAPCIQVYVDVEDIPTALAKVEQLGGKTLNSKTEIGGDMGFWAAFEDPCGCRIGIWSQT